MTHYDDAKETFRCEHGKVRGHACRFCAEGAPLLRDGRHFVDGSTVECELSKKQPSSDPSADAQRIGEIRARVAAANAHIPWLAEEKVYQAAMTARDKARNELARHSKADIPWLLQRVAQAEQERAEQAKQLERAEAHLELYISSFALCEAHAPDRWMAEECTPCEAVHLSDRVKELEADLAAARQEMTHDEALEIVRALWRCSDHAARADMLLAAARLRWREAH